MTPAQRLAPLQWAAGAASSSSVSCLASSHQQTQCEPNKRDFSSSSPFCRPSSSSSSSSHVDIADGDRRGRTARSVSFDSPAAPERKHASSCSSSPVLARGRLRHQQRRVSFKPSGLTPDDCFDFVLKSAAKKPSSDWRSGDSSTFLPAKRIEDLHYPSGYEEKLSGRGLGRGGEGVGRMQQHKRSHTLSSACLYPIGIRPNILVHLERETGREREILCRDIHRCLSVLVDIGGCRDGRYLQLLADICKWVLLRPRGGRMG